MRVTTAWPDGEMLGFDFETTGVDRFSDVPVSFALVTALGGEVVGSRAGLVDPGREVPAGATAVHGITTERARAEGMALDDAIGLVADSLVDAGRRGVPVVGMKLDYDLTILDVQCRRLRGRSLGELGWSGPVLDGLVLDRRFDKFRRGRRTLGDLCDHYDVRIDHAHDAAADAEAAMAVLRAMCVRYPELAGTALGDLYRSQVGWHREWAESYDAWRRDRDMAPLDPRDFVWPIAEVGPA